MKRDAAKRVAVVMATQPLYVVAVRSMAQFVGGERKYNGLLAPFKEIMQENGIIGGFFGDWHESQCINTTMVGLQENCHTCNSCWLIGMQFCTVLHAKE